jgi:hypothetical protein
MIAEYYSRHDNALEDMVGRTPEGTFKIIFSDHGSP